MYVRIGEPSGSGDVGVATAVPAPRGRRNPAPAEGPAGTVSAGTGATSRGRAGRGPVSARAALRGPGRWVVAWARLRRGVMDAALGGTVFRRGRSGRWAARRA